MSFLGEHDKGQSISAFYMKDASFANLMQKRIFNVLLIASRYDAFILEEDGRIEEHIFLEYMSLNLSSPPRVTEVYTFEQAKKELRENNYDLIIVMPAMQDADIFKKIGKIKAKYNDIPLVLLTPFSHVVSRRLAKEDLSAVDYTFSWLDNCQKQIGIAKPTESVINSTQILLCQSAGNFVRERS